jgi:corrinoid protein of di/trimethylamine methyltransferase
LFLTDSERALQKVADSVLSFEPDNVVTSTRQALEAGIEPMRVIEEGLAKGLRMVGEQYEKGDFFLTELIAGANAMKAGFDTLRPLIPKGAKKSIGRVVIGTVKGDIHDLGKQIVTSLLEASGFDVIDLGVDVSSSVFVGKVKELSPEILGMSVLLTTSMPEMKTVIQELKQDGLRDKVKIMVGGAVVTDNYAKEIGADAYGADAVDGAHKATRLVGSNSV